MSRFPGLDTPASLVGALAEEWELSVGAPFADAHGCCATTPTEERCSGSPHASASHSVV